MENDEEPTNVHTESSDSGSDGSSVSSSGHISVPLMQNGDNLCFFCRQVFERAEYPPFLSADKTHHAAFSTSSDAAQYGCFICHYIWNVITKARLELGLDTKRMRIADSEDFTEFGISNSDKEAPLEYDFLKYKEPGEDEMSEWRPGDGLLPKIYPPNSSGRW